MDTKTGFIIKETKGCLMRTDLVSGGPGTEVIKLFSCSMKFFLPINVKMPTIVGILTFMTRKNNILGLSQPEKC